jgi:hypothetical protein
MALSESRQEGSDNLNPLILAAATDLPQTVESMLQLVPETYTVGDSGRYCSLFTIYLFNIGLYRP